MQLLRNLSVPLAALVLMVTGSACAQTEIGYRATLSSLSTVGISGTIEIVGPTTLRFYNFTYDGRGGGRTELVLLPDRDQNTLRNLNLIDSQFQGASNGSRGAVVTGRDGGLVFAQLPQDPIAPQEFRFNTQQDVIDRRLPFDPPSLPFDPPFLPVEFDEARPVALLRGTSASPAGDASPIAFSGEINLATDIQGSTFGQNGESLTDSAGISVFCIPFGLDFGSGIFTAPSDFTNDGIVSAADYTVFRDTLGAVASSPVLPPDIVDFPSTQAFLQAFEEFVAVFDTPGELADATLDGQVNQADYNLFAEQFGATAASAAPNTSAAIAAFDAQHAAPDAEALEVLLARLTGEPFEAPEGGVGPFAPLATFTTAVPEPSAAVLVAWGLLAMTTRRRR